MANPTKEDCQLADASGNELIGAQQTNIVDLTDNSGGTASDTLAAISGTYVQAEVRNSIASLAAKITAINAVLEAHGLTSDT